MMALARVLYNDPVAPGHFRIGLGWDTPEILPGQFVMLRVSEGCDPLLRRPFCIYNVIGRKKSGPPFRGEGIEILYRVKGRGTEIMSTWTPGHRVDLIGPLGNGFPWPEQGRTVVMAAGGVGVAPLYLMASVIKGGVFLFGARNRDDAALSGDLEKLPLKLRIATEDGSTGLKGLVTDMLDEELGEGSIIYACGPPGMLRAVSAMAAQRGVPCFVSLERHMACGMGACLGCAVKTKKQGSVPLYSMVCSEGPVFRSSHIDWESF